MKSKDIVRVCIPDSHGSHADPEAIKAFLLDLKRLDADEIVMLGDHLDCGGIFSTHARSYTNEITESYEADVSATNDFLDAIHKCAPRAQVWYLEGNHEGRVSRWASSTFTSKRDADAFLERQGPAAALGLKRRGIKYIGRDDFMTGCAVPGTLRLVRGGTAIYYTHGITACQHAASTHLSKFGANVVFGHVHRAMSVHGRSVDKGLFGAWCPGTLSKLQMLYQHTGVSQWSHGFGAQFIAKSGRFVHINVPIVRGESMLAQVGRAVG